MQHGQRGSFGQRGLPVIREKAASPSSEQRLSAEGQASQRSKSGTDDKLRSFTLQVYGLMACGVAISGLVAFATYWTTVTGDPSLAALGENGAAIRMTDTEYLNDLGAQLWRTPWRYVLTFGVIVGIWFSPPFWRDLPASISLGVFVVFCGVVGVAFSGLGITYANSNIAKMFFVTSTVFGGFALFGYTTQKDLSVWGSFLWMSVFGATVVLFTSIWELRGVTRLPTIIWPFPSLIDVLMITGVIGAAGFAAYDTQLIKKAYGDQLKEEDRARVVIEGALHLYIDFVRMFEVFIRWFGFWHGSTDRWHGSRE